MEDVNWSPCSCAKKKFDFLDITWKIENFSRCNKNFILSPEFSTKGSEKSKWIFSCRVTASTKTSKVLTLRLNRIDSDLKAVGVDYRVTIVDEDDFELFNCASGRDECIRESIVEAHIRRSCKSFRPDIIKVSCEIIIMYDEGTSNTVEDCSDSGLKSLSNDLSILFESTNVFDIELEVENHIISAHKAILRARCKKLCNIIDENIVADENISRITMTDFRYDGMKKIIPYLYSGDLNYVLEEPSLAVYDCVKMLDIRELKNYYTPDKMTFKSSVVTKEFVFKWNIKDFTKILLEKNCLYNREPQELHSHIKWKTGLIYDATEDSCFLSVKTEILEPLNLHLEVGVIDQYDNLIFTATSASLEELMSPSGQKFRIGNIEKLVTANTLHLIYRFSLFENRIVSSFEKMEITSVAKTKPNASFKLLSQDLTDLFRSGLYSDKIVEIDDVKFNVHSAILAARSDYFVILMRRAHPSNCIKISGCTANIFSAFLEYLYGGVYPSIEDMSAMLRVAHDRNCPVLSEYFAEASKEEK